MVQVAGAYDDRVDLLARTILEVTDVFLNFSQNRYFFKVILPVIIHGSSAMAVGDRFRSILVALGRGIFHGIACLDNQDVLVLKFQSAPEIMGMQNQYVESLQAFEMRNFRGQKCPDATTT